MMALVGCRQCMSEPSAENGQGIGGVSVDNWHSLYNFFSNLITKAFPFATRYLSTDTW